MSEHAVTLLIRRSVKPGCEADYERVTERRMEAAARFPGHLGAQLVHPGEDPAVEDAMYHVVLAFDQQSSLDAWHDSPERNAGMDALAPFIQGEPSFRPMSGLALWYRSTNPSPPHWKVAVVTWIGIFSTVYLLFRLTADLQKSWHSCRARSCSRWRWWQ